MDRSSLRKGFILKSGTHKKLIQELKKKNIKPEIIQVTVKISFALFGQHAAIKMKIK